MKVTHWVSLADAKNMPDHLGRIGGWFDAGKRWNDYHSRINAEARPHAAALRAEVVRRRLWQDGFWHQQTPNGVPVFEDGSCAVLSFRAWGDFTAAVWSTELGRDFSYMDFYCGTPPWPHEWRDEVAS